MNAIWSFFTKHAQFGFVVLFVLLVLGALSVSATPKESTPEVDVPVAKGERLVQGIFLPVSQVEWQELSRIREESRGGIGSTGGYQG
jgi:hypothetical protein